MLETRNNSTIFVVSEFKNGQWHEILSTKDQERARARLKKLGDKGHLEELTVRTVTRLRGFP